MSLPRDVILQGMAISLALTLLLELMYARFWGLRDRHDLALAALVNILTNPIVVFVTYAARYRRLPLHAGWLTAALEAFAVVTEALLYQKFARTLQRPWLFSLSANAFSYAIGELINRIR